MLVYIFKRMLKIYCFNVPEKMLIQKISINLNTLPKKFDKKILATLLKMLTRKNVGNTSKKMFTRKCGKHSRKMLTKKCWQHFRKMLTRINVSNTSEKC
jgi:hypothetical protein